MENDNVNTESSTEEQVRTPRESENREVTQHTQSWENPSNLPSPNPQDGWVFRYIRTSLLGNSDNPNVSRKFREGWIPAKAEDHPELQVMMDHKSEWADKGHIEIGGQLLCKMPAEKAKARDEHFRNMAQNQMESVDNVYFKDQDSRMATKQVFERKSKTTFGRDS
jgi:hypothetical protein|tara:strand:+ start:555 stop:1052 length:498 start_codon:yes stop_codon:yes gene_type:complete